MFKTGQFLSVFLLALMVFSSHGNVYAAENVFQQLDDEWGLVVMEAEHYTDMIIPGTDYYEIVTEPEFFSGDGAMQVVADGAPYATGADALASSPVLTYMIDFIRADSVYIWVRGCHESGSDDSFHAGLDGAIPATSERIGYHGEPYSVWTWLGITMDNTKSAVYVDSPGLHQFEVYVRENGLKHDKFVLTTNRDYDPEIVDGDLGPDEILVGIDQTAKNAGPQNFTLNQNYPNPFNSSTTISYNLPKAGHVRLDIYNVSGHLIATLVDGFQNAGRYDFVWNASDARSVPLASGLYFARLNIESINSTIRMLLMR